jgi:phosphate transport system substrate-binding protein
MQASIRSLVLILAAIVLAIPSRAAFVARGSDSTINVVKALAAAFEQKTGTKIDIQGGGSGAGAKAAIAGEVQLAFLSRALDAKETEGGLVGATYAVDAVVAIVHKDNPVADVTVAALKDYFTGTTTQWADGRAVVLYNRNTDSGTREIFQDYVLGKGVAFSPAAAIKHDGVLLASVAKIPGALAYDGFGHADRAVIKVLSVNGVEPTAASIRSRAYPLTRTPTLATKGPAAGEVQAFIDYDLGAEGQAIVQSNGLLALK